MRSCCESQTEDRVSDQQFMLCTLIQKEEAIALALSYSFSPYHSFPGLVSVPILALKSYRRISMSVRGVAEITESRSS